MLKINKMSVNVLEITRQAPLTQQRQTGAGDFSSVLSQYVSIHITVLIMEYTVINGKFVKMN